MHDPAFEKRVDEVIADNFGVMVAMTAARAQFGDELVGAFLDNVPEKGDALWVRFRAVQKEKDPEGKFFAFNHFIASVLLPDLSALFK